MSGVIRPLVDPDDDGRAWACWCDDENGVTIGIESRTSKRIYLPLDDLLRIAIAATDRVNERMRVARDTAPSFTIAKPAAPVLTETEIQMEVLRKISQGNSGLAEVAVSLYGPNKSLCALRRTVSHLTRLAELGLVEEAHGGWWLTDAGRKAVRS